MYIVHIALSIFKIIFYISREYYRISVKSAKNMIWKDQ